MNKLPRLREPRGPVVQQVRDIFLDQEYPKAQQDFYPQDIELVKRMDFLLQRCVIMGRKQVEPSVKLLSEMLRWRKLNLVYDLDDSKFPQEITLSGAAFLYERDKFSNKTLYLRAAMCRSCPELKQAMRDYMTYLVFKLDDCREGSSYSIIIDVTGASIANYDLDLLMHLINLLKDRFPVNLDYILAINFPWILSFVWSLIKRLIPSERRDAVQFINSDKIFNFVDKENCPDFLGGTCGKAYAYLNDQAPNAIDYLHQQQSTEDPKERKMPTKKRMLEILNQFSDLLPATHIEKLRDQIENYDETNEPSSNHKFDAKNNSNTNNMDTNNNNSEDYNNNDKNETYKFNKLK